MKGYRKVLIAVNGSFGPLKEGLKLASDERCWVTVLKVVPPYEGDIELTGISDISDVLQSGRTAIKGNISTEVFKDKSLAKVRVEEGEIHETISRIADEERCDLIIMGRKKKRNFIGRLLGDNVTAKVVDSANCPVLFV